MRALVGCLVCLDIVLGHAIFGAPAAARADDTPAAPAITPVPNCTTLRDVRGNCRALYDFKSKALVIAFLGADCPISNLYLPELVALEKTYRSKGVQFLGVYPNAGEDADQIAAHAYGRDTPFLVLQDIHQKLADDLGVTRVPTVVVLDSKHKLRYRGRVDDRYGVAARRAKAQRDDLVQALDEVLVGKKVSIAETAADGCLIDRDHMGTVATDVTYSKHVAPILQTRCQACHRPGQSGPFSLLTYEDAVKHGRMIKEVTRQRRMPPWHADPCYGQFAGDRRLSDKEITSLAAWVDGGMPRGKDQDLPKPVEWVTGWTHGKPDLVLEMPVTYDVPATGVVPYQNWIIDPKFTEDRWVRIAECHPGAAGVVHHVVVYLMREGQTGPVARDGSWSILVGWAPGDLGLLLPADTALRIPKGTRFRIEMHYTPNGTPMKDRTSVGITFAKQPPKFELIQSDFTNTNIAVPANDPHYRAEATLRFPADARLLSLAPHMHYRGKDYFYEAIYPDGKRETLLSVPRWDFNWQNVYRFQEPKKMPKGTRIHAVAHWDNSANNLLNPDPGKTVRFGLQSWEEMMVGFASFVWERPETAAELARHPPKESDRLFDRFDVNGDDVITADELPQQFKTFAPMAGITIPEKMTRPDFEKVYNELRKRFPRRPGQNPGNDAKKSTEQKTSMIMAQPEAVASGTEPETSVADQLIGKAAWSAALSSQAACSSSPSAIANHSRIWARLISLRLEAKSTLVSV